MNIPEGEFDGWTVAKVNKEAGVCSVEMRRGKMNGTMYKVVRMEGNEFHSSFSTNILSYAIGKKTLPTIGKVFCFKFLSDAVVFLDSWSGIGLRIFSGIAENPKMMKRMSRHPNFDSLFWKSYKNKKRINKIDSCPCYKGTFVADSFTPTALVR